MEQSQQDLVDRNEREWREMRAKVATTFADDRASNNSICWHSDDRLMLDSPLRDLQRSLIEGST